MKNIFFTFLLAVFLSACAPMSFDPVASVGPGPSNPTETTQTVFDNSFKISTSQATFQQDQYDKNKTALTFIAKNSDGTFVNDLRQSDVLVSENSLNVSHFSFDTNSEQFVNPIDIVFVLDITGSMKPTIEAAKSKIKDFIYQIRDQKIHTRFCLVTFGDHTIQKCNKFTNNDPNDPSTIVQVEEFVHQIASLTTPTGQDDYGGTDLDEGQLRALIDATKSPWLPLSQKFAILVTDAEFHYYPGNVGDSGDDAPKYDEVLQALASSQMSVFAAAPDAPGYSSKFQRKSSLVDASQGLYFKYDQLLAGKITLGTILGKIIQRLKTTYTVSYNADDNLQLDPTLPLEKRTIGIQLKNSSANLEIKNTQSNWPNGHPQYVRQWKLASSDVHPKKVQVKINDQLILTGYSILQNSIVFDQAPAAGAKIEVNYVYKQMKENIRLTPILIATQSASPKINVFLNGKKAKQEDFSIEHTGNGQISVHLLDTVFAESDDYQIEKFNELKIRIELVVQSSSTAQL